MIQKLSDLLRRKDEGFTLIELMVVVLIIAILIAIAIPTFLGARGRAQDRAAQSGLRNALTGAKALFTDREDYSDATVPSLALAEPALTFVASNANAAPPPNTVSVDGGTSPSDTFVAAARSANGTRCWFVRDEVDPGTNPGTWWALQEIPLGTNCDAATGLLITTFDASGDTPGAWVRSPGDASVPAS